MGESRITPEKELLKLIEGSGNNAAAQIKTEALKRKVTGVFSPGALIGRISFFKDWFRQGVKGGKFYLDIKLLNNILALCIFALVVYVAANFLLSAINSKKMLNNIEVSIGKPIDSLNSAQASSLRAASYYLEKARSKNIFSMTGVVAKKEANVQEERDKINELAKNLKLVGISWSDDPDVIIEDKKSQQTFFLKKGQKINDFTIKVVFKDRIILSYGREEVELR